MGELLTIVCFRMVLQASPLKPCWHGRNALMVNCWYLSLHEQMLLYRGGPVLCEELGHAACLCLVQVKVQTVIAFEKSLEPLRKHSFLFSGCRTDQVFGSRISPLQYG